MTKEQTPYVDSEHYRQMLVRDGDRRFEEWHAKFLNYQKQFIQQVNGQGSPQTAMASEG